MSSSDRKSKSSGGSRAQAVGYSYEDNQLPANFTQSSPKNSTKKVEATPAWPTSFLFCVNELVINDEPTSGGVPPRVNANGRWLPPLESRGYYPPRPGVVFRWTEGEITVADGYQWYNGGCWSPNGYATPHRATTIFYCNRFTQMLTANGDASLRNFETSNHPDNRWWPLTFLHDRALSRVTESGDEQDLAGTGGAWIHQLGLENNRNEDRRAPVSTGLAGNLATIIGLIALSCQEGQLQTILQAGVWDRFRWRGHNLPHGREFRFYWTKYCY